MSDERHDKRDSALAAFAEYFRTNYPGPDTIISKPDWHAPKIFRAVEHALKEAGLLATAATQIDLTPNTVTLPGALYRDLIMWFERLDAMGMDADKPIVDDEGLPQRLNEAAHQSAKARREATSAAVPLSPEWCMEAFWRVNPGRNATVPSLYLLDFAREVLRVYGAKAPSAGGDSRAVECLKLVRKVLAKDKPMIGSRDDALLDRIAAVLDAAPTGTASK